MKEYRHLLEKFLSHLSKYLLSLEKQQPRELYEPESYILGLGGKRLRPLLAMIGADLYGKPEKSLDGALAVELFHNFSLIHDDILDAAPLRRNKPTVHHKWNSNIAILSGDVMLVKALQVLQKYPDPYFRKLAGVFISTAVQVCEGQQEDMNFENRNDVTVDEYIEMIRKKTAVLLGCSLQMGAITADASPEDEKNLCQFGMQTGIAFQLMDDLLDAFPGDSDKFGKQRGGDILANKKTFLLLKALSTADNSAKEQMEVLLTSTAPGKVEKMLELYESLDVRGACMQEVKKYTGKAIESLELLDVPQAKKDQLQLFAVELMGRQV